MSTVAAVITVSRGLIVNAWVKQMWHNVYSRWTNLLMVLKKTFAGMYLDRLMPMLVSSWQSQTQSTESTDSCYQSHSLFFDGFVHLAHPLFFYVTVYISIFSNFILLLTGLDWLDLSLFAPGGAGHRLLVSIQFCLVLPPPSSSSCTWNLLSTFLSLDLFSTCSLVALYFCGPAVSTVVVVWQCCHCFFSVYPSQFHFLLLSWISTGSSLVCLAICLAIVCLQSFVNICWQKLTAYLSSAA